MNRREMHGQERKVVAVFLRAVTCPIRISLSCVSAPSAYAGEYFLVGTNEKRSCVCGTRHVLVPCQCPCYFAFCFTSPPFKNQNQCQHPPLSKLHEAIVTMSCRFPKLFTNWSQSRGPGISTFHTHASRRGTLPQHAVYYYSPLEISY